MIISQLVLEDEYFHYYRGKFIYFLSVPEESSISSLRYYVRFKKHLVTYYSGYRTEGITPFYIVESLKYSDSYMPVLVASVNEIGERLI